MRILIVDDHVMNRELFAMVLKFTDARSVDCFEGTPAELLDPATYDGYDAVLLDLMMPQVGGEQVIPVIREHHPGCRIVLITGVGHHSLPPGVTDAVKATGGTVLPKPSAPEHIAKALGVR